METPKEQRTAELRKLVLADVPMGRGDDVIKLLGLSGTNAAEILREMRQRLLVIEEDGHDLYPLFQFDAEGRASYPVFIEILSIARDAGWSPYRLVYWMMRRHVDFQNNPAEALGEQPELVKDAFLRAVEPQWHG